MCIIEMVVEEEGDNVTLKCTLIISTTQGKERRKGKQRQGEIETRENDEIQSIYILLEKAEKKSKDRRSDCGEEVDGDKERPKRVE